MNPGQIKFTLVEDPAKDFFGEIQQRHSYLKNNNNIGFAAEKLFITTLFSTSLRIGAAIKFDGQCYQVSDISVIPRPNFANQYLMTLTMER